MWHTYGTENQNLYTLPTTTFLDTNRAAGLPGAGRDPSSRSVNRSCEHTLATECLTALMTGELWGQRACQREKRWSSAHRRQWSKWMSLPGIKVLES